MTSYYVGPDATNYIPFDHMQTIQHFIMPNFATMDWHRIGHDAARRNLGRLRDSDRAYYDDIMLYVHVPYCRSFCHYCNFNRSHYPWRNLDWLEQYTDYLIREIEYYMTRVPYVHSRNFTAVYIGGGSPSTLPVGAAARLFECLAKSVPRWDAIEKTFTGEPRTLRNPELLRLLVEFGFNRVTFGVESFNERHRKAIGRMDGIEDIDAVFAGLERVGYRGEKDIDLMFDLPGQTFEEFQADMDKVAEYDPDELDAFGTIYLPYRPLHKLIVQGKRPQPGNVNQLLRMREYLYDFLHARGYHNTIAETFSKRPDRTQYQTAHCARQDIIGVGTAARGNMKDMVSINPEQTDRWMRNIDEHGVSTETLQSIHHEGVLDRIMVMWPRYKELRKELFERFSGARNFRKHRRILDRHVELGIAEEHADRWTLTKLGVIWICNTQTDYMRPSLNILGKVLTDVLSEKRRNFGRSPRFKSNRLTRFIADNIDRYPKLMK